jgi:hypothetical protein
MNPYDSQAFEISTPDASRTAAGYLQPADHSLPPARIAGAEHGSRYDLDPKNTGKSEDYIEGPWVGSEIDEFIAKRGGVVGRANGGDVAPFPGWTLEQFEAPLASPVIGGPNAGPDKAAEYKQVGGEIVPVNPATSSTADPQPTSSSAVPGTSTPAASPAPHESWLVRLEEHAATLGRAAAADAKKLIAKLREVFEAAKAEL